MDREHPDAGREQPADQQPVGALNRDQLDGVSDQNLDELDDAASSWVKRRWRIFSPLSASAMRTSCHWLAQSIPQIARMRCPPRSRSS